MSGAQPSSDFFKQVLLGANELALTAMRSGQQIAEREAAAKIKALEHDCLTLVLRLYGESDDTFSPEIYEVMKRWRPRAEALLSGRVERAAA